MLASYDPHKCICVFVSLFTRTYPGYSRVNGCKIFPHISTTCVEPVSEQPGCYSTASWSCILFLNIPVYDQCYVRNRFVLGSAGRKIRSMTRGFIGGERDSFQVFKHSKMHQARSFNSPEISSSAPSWMLRQCQHSYTSQYLEWQRGHARQFCNSPAMP